MTITQIQQEAAEEQQPADAGLQLLVFEKKSERQGWRYLSSYKAGDQAELTASENTIRKTHAALHMSDGVRWAVVASEGADMSMLWERKLIRGKGTSRRLYPKSFESLEQFGAVVIELPEIVEMTAEEILRREG